MKKLNSIKTLSIFEIFILVLGTIAIAYAIGSSVGEVSAPGPDEKDEVDETGKSTTQNYAAAAPVAIEAAKLSGKIAGVNTGEMFGPPTPFKFTKFGKVLGGVGRAVWQVGVNALVAYGLSQAVRLFGPLIGLDKSATAAASKAVGWGYFAGRTAHDLLVKEAGPQLLGGKVAEFLGGKVIFGLSGTFFIGAGLAVIIFLATYKKTEEQRVSFACYQWDAPVGGANCDKCNQQGLIPCTQYQCESLGQGCEFMDQGTESLCVWKNEKDPRPPKIQPWSDALVNADYRYKPDTSIRDPEKGVYIIYNGEGRDEQGCIPPFTPFTFGITIVGGGVNDKPEPAVCKIDTERKQGFDEMMTYFGGSSNKRYNHTQTMTLPSKEALEAEGLTVVNNGEGQLFVRCQDANGNFNTGSFVFKYCVQQGPDLMAPKILGTSIENGAYIGYNTTEVPITLFMNEPSECKWSYDRDMSFDEMSGNMTCSTSVYRMNADMTYPCSTTLDGLKSQEINAFYFRCKDKPWTPKEGELRMEMNGERFTLIGTQPLVITDVGPTGTIKDSTENVKVTLTAETFGGANQGAAQCFYSESCFDEAGSKELFTSFAYDDELYTAHTHSQDIRPGMGTYNCAILCQDAGGNYDQKEFTYSVEVDFTAPEIVRAYKDEGFLKIITSEEGKCVYGTQECTYLFEDGVPMSSVDHKSHVAEWDPQTTYYIKCSDAYENPPLTNACSMIVRPFELYNGEQ